MHGYKAILVYGFAIFAMFFGSGNLVFPLEIGQLSGNRWAFGFLGLLLTGIILPFLGLFVIKLHNGKYDAFFAEGGKIAKILLPLFTLSLLGSFGVVPRCITVAYGGTHYLIPQISLLSFSIVFCIATFFLCLKDHLMIKILGKWMSPILLIALSILISAGIMKSGDSTVISEPKEAFINGVFTGYQTMDLFAAFFFSALTFSQIQQTMPKTSTNKEVIIFALKPSIVAAILLAIIYLGFVFLGAHYSDLIANVKPEFILPTIAQYTIGSSATILIAIAMVFSCITTAVALNNIYARYICSALKLNNGRFPIVLFITTSISFTISLLDFRGIAAFLAPALEVSYPGIIALTIISIFTIKYKKFKISLFYGISIFMIYKIFI